MKIYLYPDYVSIGSAHEFSPVLFELISELGITLERESWNGHIHSLPAIPAIIRGSSRMACSWKELGMRCAELGHFCFYNDCVVRPDGVLATNELIETFTNFLEKEGIV